MNILILHALGDFSTARKTSLNHLMFLQRYQPGHNYLFQDVGDPITDSLRAIRFHAVLLDVTFLCMRYLRPRSLFEEIRTKYAFVAECDAVRLAFPQDEYDHGEILDEWLDEYRTDVVYSVVRNGTNLFFSRTRQRAEIHHALTGYVEDADIGAMNGRARPFAARAIDVGYRARRLPPQFGSHGRLKTELGERFQRAVGGRPLVLDFSTRHEDVFLGDDWLGFLGNCRFTLGCEGGSSIWDPRGEIRDRVVDYSAAHPDASFEQVEAACFPGLDRVYLFSEISPRLFEVTVARSAHVLVRAPYLGILHPDEDYICLEEDFSNVADVIERLSDTDGARRMIESCYAKLIEPTTFRYSRHAREIMAKIEEKVEARRSGWAESTSAFAELAHAHATVVRAYRAAPPPPPPFSPVSGTMPLPGVVRRLRARVGRHLPRPVKQMLKWMVLAR